MTTEAKKIEDRFNNRFPAIKQAETIKKTAPLKFNKERFLKAANELRQVVQENDGRESTKS